MQVCLRDLEDDLRFVFPLHRVECGVFCPEENCDLAWATVVFGVITPSIIIAAQSISSVYNLTWQIRGLPMGVVLEFCEVAP
jgi:hypothetical protein